MREAPTNARLQLPYGGAAGNLKAQASGPPRRELVVAGKDPFAERDRQREEQAKKLRHSPRFKEYVAECVKRRTRRTTNSGAIRCDT
jgi:hypothetical protein